MRPHGPQAEHVVQTLARANRRAPRHQHLAPHGQQFFRHHQIFRGVGEHLKAIFGKNTRSLYKPEHIWLERIQLTNHFQLHPIRAEHFPRHVRCGDSLLNRVAARRVRQHRHLEFLNERPERLPGPLPRRFAAEGNSYNTRLSSQHGITQNLGRWILGRTQHEW